MNLKRALLSGLGVLILLTGLIVSLALSGYLLWGEMEARVYTQQSGERSLEIECPLMIAPGEAGTIRTVITNSLDDEDVKPQVNAFISHEKDVRVVSHTLELSPRESQRLEWTVDQADVVFERLILVNILQRPYDDLPSRQGACSILVFSLSGRTGRETITLLGMAGMTGLLFGAGLLAYLHLPLDDHRKKIAQMSAVFLLLVLAGLITSLMRFWGLTLFLDSTALLTFAVGLTEVFSKN